MAPGAAQARVVAEPAGRLQDQGIVGVDGAFGVTLGHGAPVPDKADVELLTDALAELAAALREGRDPAEMPMPESEQLSGVVDQIGAAFDAVRGPDLVERAPLRLVRRFLPDHRRA